MDSKKIMTWVGGFIAFFSFFVATIYALKVAADNDVPVLEDVYDVIS